MDKTLVVSISGIRGIYERGLDHDVIERYTAAYGHWCLSRTKDPTVVIGRDARVSGPACASIVASTLQSIGCEVIDAGLAATPTVAMAVLKERAAGGIVLSASHNPEEWNALKLLTERGEFLSPEQAAHVISRAEEDVPISKRIPTGAPVERSYLDHHIDRILDLPFIDTDAIGQRDFRVVVDGVNSVGGIAIPALLLRLGLREENIVRVNCEPTGRFAHPAEPLPENLTTTCALVSDQNADLGIVVDPDADRLALIQDGGEYFSEELTQVLAADFLWRVRKGPFVTNLSSSRAIDDVARRYGMEVYRSAVGEINVVEEMHRVGAVLGGEGNGGVILPDLHHGRDALVGSAVVLQHLTNLNASLSELRSRLPDYRMVKLKTPIGSRDPEALLNELASRYSTERVSRVDGLKIDFDDGWVHLRKSNTEPIVRVYAEAGSTAEATRLGERFMEELQVSSGS